MVGPKKERLLFGVFVLVLIVIIELTLHHFHLPAWPAIMVMIFFFVTHMEKSVIPHMILGGLVGIVGYMLAAPFVQATGSLMGAETARLVYICLFVFIIIVFGEMLPVLLNAYGFMFMLISSIAAGVEGAEPDPWLWMAVELVGGTLIILGIVGIERLMVMLNMPMHQAPVATGSGDHFE
tara:strand:- start:32414 stop:32953 length:540 start_codon:yes stop_codon:yes gene_type:complete